MDAQTQSKCVLLVDDHPAMLGHIARLLQGEFSIVAMLPDGTGLEAALARHQPDLLVLDISLPGESGIELARRLTASDCSARIVFLTVHEDADFAREALAVGGLGYVVKARLGTDLLPALRAALAGNYFISPSPALSEFSPLNAATGGSPATLEAPARLAVATVPGDGTTSPRNRQPTEP